MIMRKTLLSMAAVLMSLTAMAQDGLTAVGANIVIAPSARWSKVQYEASVLVANPDWDYGDGNTDNFNYNMLVLEDGPADDANGVRWFEQGYDETTVTPDDYGVTEDPETGELLGFRWGKQKAPFSSDATWNGMTSFRWTTNSKIADIYIRRTFTTTRALSGDVYLACGHDDAPCEYYLNGELVFSKTGWEIDHWEYLYDEWEDAEGNLIKDEEPYDSIPHYKNGWNNDEHIKLTDEQKALIKTDGSENLLAVHVHQNWGGAFADCGLYTLVEGGLEMGYVKSWDGKVIYNSYGGYNFNTNNDPHPLHKWEKLYKAQEGDAYTFHMDGASEGGEWGSQVHFKTPIPLQEGKYYTLKFNLSATKAYSAVRVKICGNNNDSDEATAYDEYVEIDPEEVTEFNEEIEGNSLIQNMKIAFDFGGGEADSDITISNISLVDEEGNEIWVGTDFFNFFYLTKDGEEIKWPEMTGRSEAPVMVDGKEVPAWTTADFDDENWETWAMPTGNSGYMNEVKTVWPGGDNTNLWVRRTFELEKVNPRLSYKLNVCHDDTYETYVNGHLLQKNTGWTNGKNPVQVFIPAKYLHAGKNVIATYIQQNWGGKFYDCGINVEEINVAEYEKALRDVLDKAMAKHDPLTKKMEENLALLIAEGRNELATYTELDALKNYAAELDAKISTILGYAGKVKDITATVALCEKEDKGYITAAIADVKANLDTCATGGQIDPMLTALRIARKKQAAERRFDKFVGAQPEAYGEYYILNVKDKRFLGGAEAWGAHAALEYASNAFQLIDTDRDGNQLEKGFRIETFRPNGTLGINDFLAYNSFVDCNVNEAWDFIPVEGKENVFNIVRASVQYEEVLEDSEGLDSIVVRHTNMREDGSLYYLGMRDGGENGIGLGFNSWNVVDSDMKDPANEGNQWMLITADELTALLQNASEENPVDATHFIVNAGYDQRLSIDSWINGSIGGGTGVWGRGGNYVDFVWENWNTDYAEVSQTIYDLPAGWYEVDLQGYYRDGHYTTHMLKKQLGLNIEQRASVYAFIGENIDEVAEDAVQKSPIASFTDGINMVPGMGRKFTDNVTWKHYDEETGEETEYKCTGDGTMSATDACWSAAEEYFQNGLYWNRSAVIYVPEGEALTIGAMKEGQEAGDWLVVDNWRLKYYGADANMQEIIDGVDDITPKAPVAGKTIYNVAGQRMNKTQKGVNIINGRKMVIK